MLVIMKKEKLATEGRGSARSRTALIVSLAAPTTLRTCPIENYSKETQICYLLRHGWGFFSWCGFSCASCPTTATAVGSFCALLLFWLHSLLLSVEFKKISKSPHLSSKRRFWGIFAAARFWTLPRTSFDASPHFPPLPTWQLLQQLKKLLPFWEQTFRLLLVLSDRVSFQLFFILYSRSLVVWIQFNQFPQFFLYQLIVFLQPF